MKGALRLRFMTWDAGPLSEQVMRFELRSDVDGARVRRETEGGEPELGRTEMGAARDGADVRQMLSTQTLTLIDEGDVGVEATVPGRFILIFTTTGTEGTGVGEGRITVGDLDVAGAVLRTVTTALVEL